VLYPEITEVTASCDWLTRTFSDEKTRRYVNEDFQATLQAWMREGAETQTWEWMGFSGVSCGGMSWGHRADCDMLRLSGGTAELLFPRFAHYGGNCSRLDVAVTFTFGHAKSNVASIWYNELMTMREPADPRSLSLIVNSKGGETLYVGSRQSDQFARLYDKGAETGLLAPGNQWRYEVEFKGERASQALKRLTTTTDRGSMYVGVVDQVPTMSAATDDVNAAIR